MGWPTRRLGRASAVACTVFALASCSSFSEETPPTDGGVPRDASDASQLADASDATPASAYAASVLADKPVLYWRLGEVSGTRAVDRSANARDGVHETSGVRLGQPSLLAGDPDPSVRITSGSSIVRRADDGLSFPGNRAFAVECWFQLASTPTTTSALVARMQDDGQLLSGYSLRVEGDGKVYFQRGEGSQISFASNAVVALDAPHHVVGVYDGSAIRLYVDGVYQGLSNQPLTLDERALDFTVGRYATGTPTLDAFVDEIAVYDYALPADRVKAHFDTGTLR